MSETDRAPRPTGLLSWLRDALATAFAAEPVPPAQWTPPRGLGLLPGLLADVTSASSRAVPVEIKRDAAGYSDLPAIAWCGLAKLPAPVGVLAVLLASESSKIARVPQYAWAIGEAVTNAAREVQREEESLADALVRRCVGDRRPGLDGRLGPQGGRWASTRQHPTGRHVRAAELLWARAAAGEPNIIARGAVQWLDCRTQIAMHRKKPATNPPPEEIVRRRYASGRRWIGPVVDAVGTVVLDPFVLTLLGPEGVDEREAQAMVADGRRRWRVRG